MPAIAARSLFPAQYALSLLACVRRPIILIKAEGNPLRRECCVATQTVGYVVLTLRAYAEGKQWVSECLELGVTSCGDTIEEALENIRDAVTLYLNTIEEQGEQPRIFRERGIVVHSGEPPDEEIPVWARPTEVVSPYVTKVPVTA